MMVTALSMLTASQTSCFVKSKACLKIVSCLCLCSEVFEVEHWAFPFKGMMISKMTVTPPMELM